MPLLTSPIDGSPMKQINRYGIEIDVCPTTGGVWLDKGELEKLMAYIKDAVDDSEQDFNNFKQAKSQQRLPKDYYEDEPRHAMPPTYARSYKKYDDDDYEDYHKYKYKKKSKMKSILDMFD